MHSDALQPKQQQQELLTYLYHILIDVMPGELPRVHSGALQLKRQSMLLIDFNELSLKQQMLFIDAMLIDELSTVVVAFELPRVENDALHLKQQVLLI